MSVKLTFVVAVLSLALGFASVAIPSILTSIDWSSYSTVQTTAKTSVLAATSTSPRVDAPDTTGNTPDPFTASNFNTDAQAQLSQLGYSLADLQRAGISVASYSGAVPRKCSTGMSASNYTEGMAIRTKALYVPCKDGQSPLHQEYIPADYDCAVTYNSSSRYSLAVLAHEVGHCLHFMYGEYGEFDTKYSVIRGESVAILGRNQLNEIIADDFMICRHGLDTDFGSGSYFSRFGVTYPTTQQCSDINAIITEYLIN